MPTLGGNEIRTLSVSHCWLAAGPFVCANTHSISLLRSQDDSRALFLFKMCHMLPTSILQPPQYTLYYTQQCLCSLDVTVVITSLGFFTFSLCLSCFSVTGTACEPPAGVSPLTDHIRTWTHTHILFLCCLHTLFQCVRI